jgi:hypothetical protein
MTTSVSNASGATCTTPGLLQTEDYIDALLGDWLSGEDRRHMILPRMGHQHLLDTDRECAALEYGWDTVMVERLDRLFQEFRRPNVR